MVYCSRCFEEVDTFEQSASTIESSSHLPCKELLRCKSKNGRKTLVSHFFASDGTPGRSFGRQHPYERTDLRPFSLVAHTGAIQGSRKHRDKTAVLNSPLQEVCTACFPYVDQLHSQYRDITVRLLKELVQGSSKQERTKLSESKESGTRSLAREASIYSWLETVSHTEALDTHRSLLDSPSSDTGSHSFSSIARKEASSGRVRDQLSTSNLLAIFGDTSAGDACGRLLKLVKKLEEKVHEDNVSPTRSFQQSSAASASPDRVGRPKRLAHRGRFSSSEALASKNIGAAEKMVSTGGVSRCSALSQYMSSSPSVPLDDHLLPLACSSEEKNSTSQDCSLLKDSEIIREGCARSEKGVVEPVRVKKSFVVLEPETFDRMQLGTVAAPFYANTCATEPDKSDPTLSSQKEAFRNLEDRMEAMEQRFVSLDHLVRSVVGL